MALAPPRDRQAESEIGTMDHQLDDLDSFFDFDQAAAAVNAEGDSLNWNDLFSDAASDVPEIDWDPELLLSLRHDPAYILDDTGLRPTNAAGAPDALSPMDVTLSGMSLENYQHSLPHYYKPQAACQYCSARQLECKVFLVEGNKSCMACASLFRTCSFVQAEQSRNGRISLLHVVNEDRSQDMGLPTTGKSLYTAGASYLDIVNDSDNAKKLPEKGGRFSRDVLQTLRSWLQAHADHPYPTEEEKVELGEQTGLNRSQVSNWLANARRRGKLRVRRNVSPAVAARSRTEPWAIPVPQNVNQSHMTPFERWKESPPENEAPVTAIKRNAAAADFGHLQSGCSSTSQSYDDRRGGSSSALSLRKGPSSTTTSWHDSHTSGSQSGGSGSMGSHGSSHSSYSSFAKKDRRRHHRLSAKHATAAKKPSKKTDAVRPFECTFCVDTFYTKYDWSRHEKSLHLNLEKWICAPDGPLGLEKATGVSVCTYCGMKEPSAQHIEIHDHSTCISKGQSSRTFLRKDHLRQHLRLVHNVAMQPHMDNWKSTPQTVRSRCGFCDATFTTWDDRAAHLASHFRSGVTMASWTGTWGFEPEVAGCVQDAMPPWMIAHERSKPQPWSASRGTTDIYETLQAEHAQGVANVSGWEVMTVVLANFVKACRERNIPITDSTLQEHARVALYGSNDPWNQTKADDPEWLGRFKVLMGLGVEQIPPNPSSSTHTDATPSGQDFSTPSSSRQPQILLGADLGVKSMGSGDTMPAPPTDIDLSTFDGWIPDEMLMQEQRRLAATSQNMPQSDLMWQMDDA